MGPSISGDGRYVALVSWATNFAPGDETNEWCGSTIYVPCEDIFVPDRTMGETTIVSVNSDGSARDAPSHSPSISGDGRYVAFDSFANTLVPRDTNTCYGSHNCDDVFVHDRTTGETTRVSIASDGTQGTEGNDESGSASISIDGRFVAFASEASNLVPGDTNETVDVFVHDRYFNYLPSYLPFIANR